MLDHFNHLDQFYQLPKSMIPATSANAFLS